MMAVGCGVEHTPLSKNEKRVLFAVTLLLVVLMIIFILTGGGNIGLLHEDGLLPPGRQSTRRSSQGSGCPFFGRT